ncbi:hypothetical protein EAG18_07580 [Pseudoalteromonas sp. J010]|uniref:magnesium transporter n=1 Tax=Pseudoalteromonas sp. J010 TaxID=998465 RepID=UPI000F648D1F|nr:magnesium transporter [Pseudoalteromonas sp. J010]RRS09294.1 hypothetical protein EAG18_07580 [Pseudoalteromonas sp. J010]
MITENPNKVCLILWKAIALKKLGLDPAQSSSIMLTIITDIAGFMSFLGIVLLLSDMLPKG